MRTYIENGYLEPSNNIAERAVKPFVNQRKVFQTSGSYAGARYTSKLFSIIQTARANNLDTYQYLDFLLENIKNKEIRIESLLPYSNEMRKKFSNTLCESRSRQNNELLRTFIIKPYIEGPKFCQFVKYLRLRSNQFFIVLVIANHCANKNSTTKC